MPVSDRVREIEQEIDGLIRGLEIWQRQKSGLLGQIVQIYRDAIEVIFIAHLFFETRGEALGLSAHDMAVLFAEEHRHRSGALWALKWAVEFCPENGPTPDATPESLADLLALGNRYEAFVDVLKAANRDAITIHVDETTKSLICYEGGQATTVDTSIVLQQRFTSPLARQISLTEDGDQVTTHWTAGDYRRITAKLTEMAAQIENDIVADLTPFFGDGAGEIVVPQPTIVWLDEPTDAESRAVFHDLVLRTDGHISTWKLVSLLDTPIVNVAGRYCALSSDLRAISVMDEHMLRLAALVDPNRYTLAATLREDRMIAKCRQVLESATPPWHVSSRVTYTNPEQEADVIATRDSVGLAIELKSTLQPEAPWEVHKRNEDIIRGVKQAKALIDRGVANFGFVITDGYRGDYACWAEALSSQVTIGTLDDLVEIGLNPTVAATSLRAKVGITDDAFGSHENLPDREDELMGWKIRLVDSAAPAITCQG